MQIGIKTICVLLGASFMLSVAGCGKQPEEPKSSETKNDVQVTISSESATDASAAPSSGGDEDLKDYNRAFCVEYDKMFINYNKKYDTSVEAFSHGFYFISKFVSKDSKERDCVPVLVCYDDEVFGKPFDGKLDDIFNIYNNAGIIFGDKDGEDLRQKMDKEIDCMMKTVRNEKIKEGITID